MKKKNLREIATYLLIVCMLFNTVQPIIAGVGGEPAIEEHLVEAYDDCNIENAETVLDGKDQNDILENGHETGENQEEIRLRDIEKNNEAMPFMFDSLESSSVKKRYTVLLLETDIGISLNYGGTTIYRAKTPIEEMKQAATKFVNQVRSADGINYIAIVTYSSNAHIESNFSDNSESLNEIISNIQEDSNFGSNIGAAYDQAAELLDQISEKNALKNIVLFTQGMDTAGNYLSYGNYTRGDCDWKVKGNTYIYQYANYVYNRAKELMKKYDIYSIGFFNKFEEVPTEGRPLLQFMMKFCEDIQNAGYQIVDDVANLDFAFNDIADNIISHFDYIKDTWNFENPT